MESVFAFLATVIAFIKGTNWLEIVGAVSIVLHALIGIFTLVPGEQPEKFLQWLVDWIESKSRK